MGTKKEDSDFLEEDSFDDFDQEIDAFELG